MPETISFTIKIDDAPNLKPKGIKKLMDKHGMAHQPYNFSSNMKTGTITITGKRVEV
jgi:hypothetical protein